MRYCPACGDERGAGTSRCFKCDDTTALSDCPTSPPELVYDFLAIALFAEFFQAVDPSDDADRQTYLRAIKPTALVRAIRKGERNLRRVLDSDLFEETLQAAGKLVDIAEYELSKLESDWRHVSELVDSAGARGAQEAQNSVAPTIGALIGGVLFGRTGSVLGGMAGGFLAGTKADRATKEAADEYLEMLSDAAEELHLFYEKHLLPAFINEGGDPHTELS